MHKTILLALLAATACSGTKTEKRAVSAVITADFTTGHLVLQCRDSTSGTCHLLIAGAGTATPLSAARGASAETDGVRDGAQFCAGASAPQTGCRLHPLRDGEQIYRESEVKSETR